MRKHFFDLEKPFPGRRIEIGNIREDPGGIGSNPEGGGGDQKISQMSRYIRYTGEMME